jgi:hypothetical protein
MPTVVVHIMNEDAIQGELDNLPGLTDVIIPLKNPRMRDGKDVKNLDPNVTLVLFPISRLTFIEVMPSEEEEEIITHVRE